MIREEIREGIAKLCANGMRDCNYECATCQELNGVLKGVVIKVDRELPETRCARSVRCYPECHTVEQDNMLKAGYVAVEPLIET